MVEKTVLKKGIARETLFIIFLGIIALIVIIAFFVPAVRKGIEELLNTLTKIIETFFNTTKE